jgi:hypothetical protein
MQLKPLTKQPPIKKLSYFQLTPQLLLTVIHDDVNDAVIHSVSRGEKITLSIKFSQNSSDISSKRTSYTGKVIDMRTFVPNPRSKNAIEDTTRRNVTRTLNLAAQMLQDENLFESGILAELKMVFSLGKLVSITTSRSKEFGNRHE